MKFLAILLSLVHSNGLMLHILIDKNDIEVLMVIKLMGSVINYA